MVKRASAAALVAPCAPAERWSVPDDAIEWSHVLCDLVSKFREQTLFSWLPRDVLNIVGAFAGRKPSKADWQQACDLMHREGKRPNKIFLFFDKPWRSWNHVVCEALVAHGFVERALRMMRLRTGKRLEQVCDALTLVLYQACFGVLRLSSDDINYVIDRLCFVLMSRNNNEEDAGIILLTYFYYFADVLCRSGRVHFLSSRSIDQILSSLKNYREQPPLDRDDCADEDAMRLIDNLTECDSEFARRVCVHDAQWIQALGEDLTHLAVVECVQVPALACVLRLARFGHWTVSRRALNAVQRLVTLPDPDPVNQLPLQPDEGRPLYEEITLLSDTQLSELFPADSDLLRAFVTHLIAHRQYSTAKGWPVILAVLRLGSEYAASLHGLGADFARFWRSTCFYDRSATEQFWPPPDGTPLAVLAQLVRYSPTCSDWAQDFKSMIVLGLIAVQDGRSIGDDDLMVLLVAFRALLQRHGLDLFDEMQSYHAVDIDGGGFHAKWLIVIDIARRRRADLWVLAVECGEILKRLAAAECDSEQDESCSQ